jgi:hypothetical protein
MRIRLLAAPPLSVVVGATEYSVEFRLRDGVGIVVAKQRRNPETIFTLGQVEHEGEDVHVAWREGLKVFSSAEAQRLAAALVKSGLADDLPVEAAPTSEGPDRRGLPH